MNEKEILTASMAEHQRAIDKAKTELEQLDKPKLRHGDYGIDPRYGGFFINQPERTNAGFADKKGGAEYSDGHFNSLCYLSSNKAVKYGNIFDDLKRNSEDLDEFSLKGMFKDEACFYLTDEKEKYRLKIAHNGSSPLGYTLSQATEIHQKLGQLIATAKRRAK